MTEQITIYLKTLNYHKNWLNFGFLTVDNLINQANKFHQGYDKNTEHFRYNSFIEFINAHQKFTDLQIEQFIILVSQDIDDVMAGSALRELYLSEKLSDHQNALVENCLVSFGEWAIRLINKKQGVL